MGSLCAKCFRPTEASSRSDQAPAPESPKTEDIDPRLPLTARQKFQISKSWKGIERALTPTAVSMFIKLFEGNEKLLDLFQKFSNLRTKDAQRQSEELAEHATNVFGTIHNAICSLDSVDSFLGQLKQIGGMHVRIEGFKSDYFWKIEQPFLEAVKETLEDRYTENIEAIYQITIKLIIKTLVEGYEEAKAANNNNNSNSNTNTTLNAKTSNNNNVNSSQTAKPDSNSTVNPQESTDTTKTNVTNQQSNTEQTVSG